MKRRMGIALFMVLAIAMMGVGACAMPVRIEEGGAYTVTAATVADGSEYALETTEFQLLGRGSGGTYLIFADGKYLKVTRGDLKDIIDSVGLPAIATLPSITEFKLLQRNSRGDDVAALQDALKTLGYLSGKTDGDFGGGSQRAISAFQKDHGLEETGEADELIQMLVLSCAAEEVVAKVESEPSERFAAILGKTDSDLTVAMEKGLGFEYDDIAGTGLIADDTVIEYSAPAESDIEKCDVSVRFALRVRQDADGMVVIDPVMLLNAIGARRPIMQQIILKSGDERYTYAITDAASALEGVKSVESASVALDDNAVAMLANAAEEGELKLRLTCKYGTYDIEVPAESLASVSNIGAAAQGLNP